MARQILVDDGYAAFSMESVAAAAGVSRSTLYRRWSSKQELVVACARVLVLDDLVADDQGSFAADVRQLITARIRLVRTGAFALIAATMAATAEVPSLRKQVVDRNLAMLGVTEEIIERGRQRGDVAPDVDASVLRLLVSAPILFSVLQLDEDPDDAFVDSLIELISRAVS